ncbi:hypothetical protein B0H19DRAFT_1185336, partial [Mycena capillaripes]
MIYYDAAYATNKNFALYLTKKLLDFQAFRQFCQAGEHAPASNLHRRAPMDDGRLHTRHIQPCELCV